MWDALKSRLRDEDVLLHGLRFTDPVEGDVEIDLLVLMPELGMAVIEVKGGHLSYANGEVRQTGANGVEVIDPAEQARRQDRAVRRFLKRRPDWSRGSVAGTWLVAAPFTHLTEGLGPELPFEVLIGENHLDDALGRVYDRLRAPSLDQHRPPTHWVPEAVDAFLGSLDSPAEIQARTAHRLRHVDDLTEQQRALLQLVRRVPRYEVTGAAGTGKTWMAIEQARRWAEAGERVALVSYTRGVIEVVRQTMSELPVDQQPVFLGTFFQLGYQWGIHADSADDQDFWQHRGPKQMRAHAEALPQAERFTALVVDEGQDFADDWWPALLAASTPDTKVALFRDDEQAVFSERRGRPELDLTPLVLDENLRNARQVVDTFRPLISADVVSRAGEGFPVEFVKVAEEGDVLGAADDVVAELVDRRGWLPEQVALLTTRHRHPVQVERDGDKAAYWRDLWSHDDVFYSTVAGFKGLERPVIVLALNGFHDNVEPRHVLYAGMSRARDLLIIVGSAGEIAKAGDRKLLNRLTRATS